MKKKVIITVAVLAVAAALSAVLFFGKADSEFTRSAFLMDTNVSITVKGDEDCTQDIESLISHLEKDCYSRKSENADISKVNDKGSFDCDSRTAYVVSKALEICKNSNGVLDIGLGALSDIWNVTAQNPVMPDKSEISGLAGSKYPLISVNGKTVSVSAPAVIDLGSVGKGAACDEVFGYLSKTSVSRCVVAIGGSVMLYGRGDFRVGIASPEKGSSQYIAVITTGQGFVSTSGTYERYFDWQGKRMHHILDPMTGYPVDNNLLSVTIISDNGLVSDALSTACFVMGLDEGMKFAADNNCEAVFVTDSGKIYTTDNVRIDITDTAYTLVK